LVISGVVIGFTAFQTSFFTRYGVQVPTHDMAMYNTQSNVTAAANTLQGNQTGIMNVIQNIPILGSFASLLIARVQSVVTMLTVVPEVFGNLITDMGSIIGLPGWFTGIILSAVTLMIIWSLISQTIVKGRV